MTPQHKYLKYHIHKYHLFVFVQPMYDWVSLIYFQVCGFDIYMGNRLQNVQWVVKHHILKVYHHNHLDSFFHKMNSV